MVAFQMISRKIPGPTIVPFVWRVSQKFMGGSRGEMEAQSHRARLSLTAVDILSQKFFVVRLFCELQDV